MLRLIALAFCCVIHFSPAHAGLKDYPFRVAAKKLDTETQLVAQNDGPSTVTAHVAVSGDNMESAASWPMTVVLRPYTSSTLGAISNVDRTRPGSFSYRVSVQYGDVRSVHSPEARYRLPYENGSAFLISQAYGSQLTTHAEAHSEHAVDFGLPEGTPILAARDGLIVDMTLSFDRGGLDPDLRDKANVVLILHDDGTVAHYAHLGQRKPAVSRGQYVRAGTLIGYSGDTGYSQGPHLHFAVTRPEVSRDGVVKHVAIPVVFYAGIPAVDFAPQRGMQVTAVYVQTPATIAANVSAPASAAEHGAVDTLAFQSSAAAPQPAPAQPFQVGTAPQAAPAPAVTRTVEADTFFALSAIDMGLAFLVAMVGLLWLLAPKDRRRAL